MTKVSSNDEAFSGVGVAIAKKKKRDQQQMRTNESSNADKLDHGNPTNEHGMETSKVPSKTKLSPGRPSSALRDFVNGTLLYCLCLGLPTLLGVALRQYETWTGRSLWKDMVRIVDNYYGQLLHYLCHTWQLWCPNPDPSPTLAPDAEWTDFGVVAILSLSLALIRIAFVHLLVPRYLAPQRLEALVRCKSLHLLSSAYPKSMTPRSSMRLTVGNLLLGDDEQSMMLPPPPLMLPMEPSVLFPPQRPWWSTRLAQCWTFLYRIWSTCRRSGRRVLGLEAKAPYDGEDLQDTDRLFAGPRYATAVFRLFYCLASCTCAIVWFRHANFWPPAVGGSGASRHCWDLKGGVALEDFGSTDFDQRNAVLRLYFLVQASYHLHSWATHWLSMLVLWCYGQQSLVSMRKSMKSYWRALLQHLLALGIIGGCYLFSSLRRLGAIGIFALDFSSLFVHLLQLCMNAPEDSWLRKPSVITFVHRGLVIPTFLYTRFFVFPFVVYYSAVYESHNWLRQMERTLFPGSAHAMTLLFHAFLLGVLVLNLILTKRLLSHPHLERVLSDANTPKQDY